MNVQAIIDANPEPVQFNKNDGGEVENTEHDNFHNFLMTLSIIINTPIYADDGGEIITKPINLDPFNQ